MVARRRPFWLEKPGRDSRGVLKKAAHPGAAPSRCYQQVTCSCFSALINCPPWALWRQNDVQSCDGRRERPGGVESVLRRAARHAGCAARHCQQEPLFLPGAARHLWHHHAHQRRARDVCQWRHHRVCDAVARAGRCLPRRRGGAWRHHLRRPAGLARRPGRSALPGLCARPGRQQALRAAPPAEEMRVQALWLWAPGRSTARTLPLPPPPQ